MRADGAVLRTGLQLFLGGGSGLLGGQVVLAKHTIFSDVILLIMRSSQQFRHFLSLPRSCMSATRLMVALTTLPISLAAFACRFELRIAGLPETVAA